MLRTTTSSPGKSRRSGSSSRPIWIRRRRNARLDGSERRAAAPGQHRSPERSATSSSAHLPSPVRHSMAAPFSQQSIPATESASDQASARFPRRIKVMVQFNLPKNSQLTEARLGPPPGANNLQEFRIYRWNPDDGANPRIDTYLGRPRRLRPDGARRADQDQERDRPDADLPPLLPRGHLRLLRDEHRRAEHARLHHGDRRDARATVKIYPLPHMPVIKDLVPDLTQLLRAVRLDQALAADRDAAAREGAAADARRTARSSTGFTSASCAPAARRRARATGGTATATSARRSCSQAYRWLIDSRDETTGERLDELRGPVPPLSLPHDHELRQGLPEGPEPGARRSPRSRR